MKTAPTCPRCGGDVRPPGVWASHWTCASHGAVSPVQPPGRPGAEYLRHVASRSGVPVWLPWPLPKGWVVSGVLRAGDDAEGVRATAVALSGPNPLGGPGDMVVVAEEPGVGLGARFAGLPGPDPGTVVGNGQPHARVSVSHHEAPLWSVASPPDRAAYAGESHGRWLWLVLRPQTAGALLLEDLGVADARDLGHEVDLIPYGALSPWFAPGAR